jgi:hypothetical protein
MMRPDIDSYRVNYDLMKWDDVRYANFPAPGACAAIATLCDAYEAVEKQRDELLEALETVNESAVCFAKNEYSISAEAISKVENAIASAKGPAS